MHIKFALAVFLFAYISVSDADLAVVDVSSIPIRRKQSRSALIPFVALLSRSEEFDLRWVPTEAYIDFSGGLKPRLWLSKGDYDLDLKLHSIPIKLDYERQGSCVINELNEQNYKGKIGVAGQYVDNSMWAPWPDKEVGVLIRAVVTIETVKNMLSKQCIASLSID